MQVGLWLREFLVGENKRGHFSSTYVVKATTVQCPEQTLCAGEVDELVSYAQ